MDQDIPVVHDTPKLCSKITTFSSYFFCYLAKCPVEEKIQNNDCTRFITLT